MRRRASGRNLAGLIGALTLSGTSLAAPALHAQKGMSWAFSQWPGKDPQLAFGTSESDVLVIAMSCKPHAGRIDLAAPNVAKIGRSLELISGPLKTRLKARFKDEEMGPFLYAATKATDPVLHRFARTGEFVLGLPEGRIALPAPNPIPVREFLAICQ